jgi:hypothetical protein
MFWASIKAGESHQLRAPLSRMHDAWEHVGVQAVSYTHTSWRVADMVCLIGAAARYCTQEDPSCSEEMEAWLLTLEVADLQGEFLASIPLFFAVARKGR